VLVAPIVLVGTPALVAPQPPSKEQVIAFASSIESSS
jgi:hypothetical protein